MGNFILYAEQRTSGQADACSAASIQGALQLILGLQDSMCNITIGGSWVGAPRVTRQASFVIWGPDRFTRVAALFQYPDGGTAGTASDQAIQNCIQNIANFELPLIGVGWQPAQILPFDPSVNGTTDWWTSGQAAATHTKDAFDLNQQTGGTSTIENPTGPQSATPPSDLDTTPTISSQTTSLIMTAIYATAGGIALYFLWPVLMGARNMASAAVDAGSAQTLRQRNQPTRNNPRRRRAKRLSAFHTR